MIVCDRSILWGGARGPPGTEGLVEMLITRGAGVTGGFLVRSLPPPGEEIGLLLGFAPLAEVKLAFLPREAKNPPVLIIGVDGAKDRKEDGGVLLATLEVRAGNIRWLCASDG